MCLHTRVIFPPCSVCLLWAFVGYSCGWNYHWVFRRTKSPHLKDKRCYFELITHHWTNGADWCLPFCLTLLKISNTIQLAATYFWFILLHNTHGMLENLANFTCSLWYFKWLALRHCYNSINYKQTKSMHIKQLSLADFSTNQNKMQYRWWWI